MLKVFFCMKPGKHWRWITLDDQGCSQGSRIWCSSTLLAQVTTTLEDAAG